MARPGIVAAIIVKRSRILKPSHKLLWLEHWLLGRNTADGWIALSQEALADRLAIHIGTVKRCCSVLETVGLLEFRVVSRRKPRERRAAFPGAPLPAQIPDLDSQLRLQARLDSEIEGALRQTPQSTAGLNREVAPCDHSEVAGCDHSEVPKRSPCNERKRGGKGGGDLVTKLVPNPISPLRGGPDGNALSLIEAYKRELAKHMTESTTKRKRVEV